MQAIVAGSSGLELREVAAPAPAAHEVLVRVHAAGLNRAELAMASGRKHGEHGGAGAVMGLEWSGVVAAVGADVPHVAPHFAAGQRVMASGHGGHAEFAVADWGRVCAIPPGMKSIEAAALPIALQTAHHALAGAGQLAAGQAVLVRGASSAVGLMALLIARHLRAGLVIGTSGAPHRRARMAAFADLVVDSSREDWVETVLAATGGRGADLTVDFVSGPTINQTLRATAVLGRVIDNGRLGGSPAEFDFDLHAQRRISYIGSSFRSRSREEVRDINRRMRDDLWPALQAGGLRLPVDAVFPLAQAEAAHARMTSGDRFGKVVLSVRGGG